MKRISFLVTFSPSRRKILIQKRFKGKEKTKTNFKRQQISAILFPALTGGILQHDEETNTHLLTLRSYEADLFPFLLHMIWVLSRHLCVLQDRFANEQRFDLGSTYADPSKNYSAFTSVCEDIFCCHHNPPTPDFDSRLTETIHGLLSQGDGRVRHQPVFRMDTQYKSSKKT